MHRGRGRLLLLAAGFLAAAGCGRSPLLSKVAAGTGGSTSGADGPSALADAGRDLVVNDGSDGRPDLAFDAAAVADEGPDRGPDLAIDAVAIADGMHDGKPDAAVERETEVRDALSHDEALRDFADGNRMDGADTGEPAGPQLRLLAGGLGGPGDQDGLGAAAGFNHPAAVASDGAGNLFVADAQNHTVRKVVLATGAVSTLAGSPGLAGSADGTGSAARFSMPWGLASDGSGNLFVADIGNHTIRKVVIASGAVTTVAGTADMAGTIDGTGAAARFYGPAGLAADGAGNLFVTDRDGQILRKIVLASGVVTTLAGSPVIAGSADGIGSAAQFHGPQGVVSDGAGNLFVADTWNNTLRKVVIATGAVTTLAGVAGKVGASDGDPLAARFDNPAGPTLDGLGNLFVADTSNNTVRKVAIASGMVSTLAGLATTSGSADGTGTAARFYFPRGVASDGAGNLFVADEDNHTIRKIAMATGAVTTLAGMVAAPDAVDGIGAAARFSGPRGLVEDGAGNLFVADTANAVIRKIVIATGATSTFAGSAGSQDSVDGIGSAARFGGPYDLTADGAGNLFVADQGNCTIRQIRLATAEVTTLAGSRESCYDMDGIGTAAGFGSPFALVSDGAGSLFVADYSGHTIRKIVVATATVSTFAGAANYCGSQDGIGAEATFCVPAGITTDGAGSLFVTDYYNATIRRIDIGTAAVTTLAGSVRNAGSTDGTGAAARFMGPVGVASDRAGNLYVADEGNHLVRKIVVATQAVSTVVGVPARSGHVFGPLPAELVAPVGLAFDGQGRLFITDQDAVLVADF